MARVIMLGPPGAGKGTQSVLLSAEQKVPHISTGDMMRASVAAGSELGKRVKQFLDDGKLVPDETVIEVVKSRLAQADCANGFVLDGFPRTLAQAQMLEKLLAEEKKPATHVLYLHVPRDVLVERIKGRQASGSGRSDDTEEVAIRRLAVYLQETAPVVGFYREKHKGFREIDGLGTVEEVTDRIRTVVLSLSRGIEPGR